MTKRTTEDVALRFNVHDDIGDDMLEWMAATRQGYAEMAMDIVDTLVPSRAQAMALTKLEEAMFWTNAAAARTEGKPCGYGGRDESKS